MLADLVFLLRLLRSLEPARPSGCVHLAQFDVSTCALEVHAVSYLELSQSTTASLDLSNEDASSLELSDSATSSCSVEDDVVSTVTLTVEEC